MKKNKELSYLDQRTLEPWLRKMPLTTPPEVLLAETKKLLHRPVSWWQIYRFQKIVGIMPTRQPKILRKEDIQRLEALLRARGHVLVYRGKTRIYMTTPEEAQRNSLRAKKSRLWEKSPNGESHVQPALAPHS